MKVKEICDYSGSTLLGMNGGMVESPDSKRQAHTSKAATESVTGILKIIARYMMYTAAITMVRPRRL